VNGLLLVLGVALVVAGLAGTILPALPGVPLVFLGLLIAAADDGFHRVGWITLTILFLMMLAALVVDAVASSLGARKMGASWQAMVGASLGAFAGLFLGLPGLLLGPFVGATLGEWYARRDLKRAGKIGLAAWVGLLLGTACKLAIAFAMVALWVFVYFV
jgi:uncharacterized protein YqgC (DUF456 family)